MVSYQLFFLITLISILGPVIGILLIVFNSMLEQEIHVLEIENRRIFLESELQKSEYLQLTQQIQPHFLFNTLNSLLSLARFKRLDQLIPSFEHLVLYLRYKYQVKCQLNPLDQEIDHTKHYLAIQHLRYGDRLQIEWQVEPGLDRAMIPSYLIQILVENAFKHGLEQVEERACLWITICKKVINQDNYVELVVQDNGPGFLYDPLEEREDDQDQKKGIGLTNIAKRINLLFSHQAKLEVVVNSSLHQGGMIKACWPLKQVLNSDGDSFTPSEF
ncbi:sensor histidine kinase [Candidatus Formimonas warabiya]|uniref:Sensor histidine kinase n=1 Tax=Formimonas warabiya TaxID=1761012 RepID=A0A3G1L0B6_FORW1|nr:histidine kinase [Candidatus Formimonas warabiya]ATW28084.1 sensor histidine kinase [Candidatus Formimonas warabiya]